jgi:hypothetical protein
VRGFNQNVVAANMTEARYVFRPSEVPEFYNDWQITAVIELRYLSVSPSAGAW